MTKSTAFRLLTTFLVLTSLSACDMVAGAGKDIQKAGAAITQQAQKTQAGM
ncbi:MAG: entericidin A/B family lipoprotein [Paracoccaceae bacterium]|nr:entericidin A/B family lipoprotein [Paracoccaceae bacterium]MDE3240273.1 entericidin A/B family lipoprotein [Paracoccaceae bacterium]